jgi:hypothetical protein
VPGVWRDQCVMSTLSIVVRVMFDLISWCGLVLRPRKTLEAEVLSLRKQLALYVERGVKPRRIHVATSGCRLAPPRPTRPSPS